MAQKEHKKVQTDVLVAGGGTAGFAAAIAAARNGARVILVEQRDHLGGTHSGGMVMMIRSMRHMRAPHGANHKKVMIGSVVDVHDKDGKESLLLAEVGGSGWFHIPYRTLVPSGLKNLLVAGRCISADYVAQGCTRSQAACMMTGQATGTAAALAVRAGVEPRAISIAELQTTLVAQNQLI